MQNQMSSIIERNQFHSHTSKQSDRQFFYTEKKLGENFNEIVQCKVKAYEWEFQL